MKRDSLNGSPESTLNVQIPISNPDRLKRDKTNDLWIPQSGEEKLMKRQMDLSLEGTSRKHFQKYIHAKPIETKEEEEEDEVEAEKSRSSREREKEIESIINEGT